MYQQWYGVGISRACVHSPADMDPCQMDGGIPHRFDSANLSRPFAPAADTNTSGDGGKHGSSTEGGARQSKPGRSFAFVASEEMMASSPRGYIVPVHPGILGTYLSPSRLITEPEPEPHGSIASCHGAGPRDGPCDREWFLIRQRRPTRKAGRAQPALQLAPGQTAASLIRR